MDLNTVCRLGVVVGLAGLGVACGGGVPVVLGDGGVASSELRGTVLLAPVSGATVVAYRASATLQRGAVLAQGAADEAGHFELHLPPWQGHVLLVASGGTYVEQASGITVQLGDNQLQLLIPDFRTGTKLNTLRVTPISSMALALAEYHLDAGVAVAAAYQEALTHLNAHLGGVDWGNVAAADFGADGGVTSLAAEARAGLVLAGLSWLSQQQAQASGYSPGLLLNTGSLGTALVRDAADGTFDGKAGSAAVAQGAAVLSGYTLRTDLAKAITEFIASPRNGSLLRLPDIAGMVTAIRTNSDPYLFCSGQVATASCAGEADTTPPTVTVASPPPAFTNASNVTIAATYLDTGAGMAAARATYTVPLQPTPSEVAGTCTPTGAGTSSCTFVVPLPVADASQTTITLWGEDAASPPNGSPTAGPPYTSTYTVTRDTTPPAVSISPAASYYDERGLTVAIDSTTGVPLVPPQYGYTGALAVVDPDGGAIFKVRSKSGAGDDNIPFLRWGVRNSTAGESPVVAETWTLVLVDGVAPPTPAHGDLRRSSSRPPSGYSWFELPVVGLPTGELVLGVTFTDGAGNVTTIQARVSYTLVAPPLVIVPDDAYSTQYTYDAKTDPLDLWAYGQTHNYAGLWSGAMRTRRWTVYNPNPEPVLLGSSSSSIEATWNEQWRENLEYSLPSGNFTDDNPSRVWPATTWWYSDGPDLSTVAPVFGHPAYECPGGMFQGEPCYGVAGGFECDAASQPTHYLGANDAGFLRCEARGNHLTPTSFTRPFAPTSDFAAFAPAGPTGAGGEASSALAVTTTRGSQSGWLIPPAVNASTPSAVALYATLQLPPRPSGGLPVDDLPVTGGTSFRAGWTYNELYGNDGLPLSQLAVASCRNYVCTSVSYFYNHQWQGKYFDRSLEHVSWSQTGSLMPFTAPCGADAVCSSTNTLTTPLPPLSVSFAPLVF